MKFIKIILYILFFVQLAVQAQLPVTLQKVKLAGSNTYRDVYVTRSGNDYLMNGDIIVDQYNKNAALQSNTNGNYTWPKGYIPVEIEDSIFMFGFDGNLYRAIDFLNTNTRVKFKPRTNETEYIYVNYMSTMELGFAGGSSWVGKKGGRQALNLSSSNYRTILHELLHAIGFWHEQSRPDRDSFVEIQWNNIESEDSKHNFQIESGTPNGAYDYLSIMHYFSSSFAKPGTVTIRCKSGAVVSDCAMGGTTMSAGDIRGVNDAYWYNAATPLIAFQTEYEKRRQLKIFKDNAGPFLNTPMPVAKNLANGMYKIKINQTGKYLAIDGVSKENGARLVQWDYVDQANHKFYVRSIGDGYYEISAVHSNRFLNAANQSKADGTLIIQWDYANQDNVKWKIYHNQQRLNPGWVIENKNASPIQLQGGVLNNQNGIPFILWMPKRHDAHDYDPYQTFTFEKIGELKMSEVKLYDNSPSMKIIKKNNP
jgi:hypothetical protein